MPKMNLSVFLSTYSDSNASNNPSLSNFKWNRTINGIAVNNALSQTITLAPGASYTFFTGSIVKTLIYMETDLLINYSVNSSVPAPLKPIVINNSVFPGVLLQSSDITSLVVTNPSMTDSADIFLATVE